MLLLTIVLDEKGIVHTPNARNGKALCGRTFSPKQMQEVHLADETLDHNEFCPECKEIWLAFSKGIYKNENENAS